MAKVHGAAYAKMANAKPVAVVDIRKEAADELAASIGAQGFTDFDAMLQAVDPDVIDVCTPTPFHKPYVLKAAEAGKHVITEKPMGRSLDECREMIATTDKAGVKFMVAHVLRFFPEFAAAKAQIDAGAVGKPAIVRTTRGGGFPTGSDDWYANVEMSGGLILDLIIHDFDWLRWCFGEADRVYAKGLAHSRLDHIDYALVTIRFKSGVIAHVEGTWANPSGFTVKFEVAGDQGLLDFYNKETAPVTVAQKDGGAKKAGVTIPESPTAQNPYYLELQHFIDCIEGDCAPSITAEDGLRAVEISLAALESLKTGKPVSVGA